MTEIQQTAVEDPIANPLPFHCGDGSVTGTIMFSPGKIHQAAKADTSEVCDNPNTKTIPRDIHDYSYLTGDPNVQLNAIQRGTFFYFSGQTLMIYIKVEPWFRPFRSHISIGGESVQWKEDTDTNGSLMFYATVPSYTGDEFRQISHLYQIQDASWATHAIHVLPPDWKLQEQQDCFEAAAFNYTKKPRFCIELRPGFVYPTVQLLLDNEPSPHSIFIDENQARIIVSLEKPVGRGMHTIVLFYNIDTKSGYTVKMFEFAK